MTKVVLSWSGGKDSMTALHRLQKDQGTKVCGLMTAFHGKEEVVNLHYIPISLINKQADALGLDLYPIYLTDNAPNVEYESKHKAMFAQLQEQGIHETAFGDIHLEPIREYRDRLLAESGMGGNYPLWHEEQVALLGEFLDAGYEAIITSIDALKVPERFLGQKLNRNVMRELEELNLDPCGENGEYHTFVFNGPGFQFPVEFAVGEEFEQDFRPEVEMKLRVVRLQ